MSAYEPVFVWTVRDERVTEFLEAGLAADTSEHFADLLDIIDSPGDEPIYTIIRPLRRQPMNAKTILADLKERFNQSLPVGSTGARQVEQGTGEQERFRTSPAQPADAGASDSRAKTEQEIIDGLENMRRTALRVAE